MNQIPNNQIWIETFDTNVVATYNHAVIFSSVRCYRSPRLTDLQVNQIIEYGLWGTLIDNCWGYNKELNKGRNYLEEMDNHRPGRVWSNMAEKSQ